MNERHFDAWTRLTARPLFRRRSILTLSGATLVGAVAGPSMARAGQRGKQCKKKCQQQASQCENVVRPYCEEVDPGGNGCLQRVLPCCYPLTSCDAAASTQCFIDNLVATGSPGAP